MVVAEAAGLYLYVPCCFGDSSVLRLRGGAGWAAATLRCCSARRWPAVTFKGVGADMASSLRHRVAGVQVGTSGTVLGDSP